MVKLFCAIVGVVSSSFSVRVDESDSVDDLKKAIKAEKPNKITCDADDLQLFLAKTEGGAWLTEADVKNGVKDTTGLKLLDAARARLRRVGLSDKDVGGVDEEEEAEGRGPVNVLVKVPEGDRELKSILSHDSLTRIQEDNVRMWHNATEELREQMRKQVEEMGHRFERALKPATPSKSDSELGKYYLEPLRRAECVSCAVETAGADAFWSVEVQAEANAKTRETDFYAFITPYFSSALNTDDVVFVNSEFYKWLPQSTCGDSNTALKPDGFVTHRGMYHKMPGPNDKVSRVGTEFRFGKADTALFDCLVLFECKTTNKLEGAPFGQVVRYMQHLLPKGPGSAVLFNQTTFWLINSLNGVVVRVITARWVMEGSKALFRDFITKNLSPWVTRLTAACSAFNVKVVEGDAFLGRGAFGRVFKVKRVGQDGDVLALKIVEASSVGRLFQEKDALVRAQHTGLAIRPVGMATEISDGAAMLLSPVGEPISYPTTKQEVQTLFDMLWQLHSAGVAHGDPRVPNVIGKDGQRLWIDLVESRDASPLLLANDAKILTQSILHGSPKDSTDLELETLINSYGASPTRTNLGLLTDRLGEKLAAS